MAQEMGVEILSEAEYRKLQELETLIQKHRVGLKRQWR